MRHFIAIMIVAASSVYGAELNRSEEIDRQIDQLKKELHGYRIKELHNDVEQISAGRYDYDEFVQEVGETEEDRKNVNDLLQQIHALEDEKAALEKTK